MSTRLSSLISPSLAFEKTSSRVILRAWRRASASVLSRIARSRASWRAWRSFSTTWTCSPASPTPSKPSTSTGIAGRGRLDPLALEVVHRPDPAPLRTGDDRVADAEGSALDEHGDDGAAARVEVRLDHGAGSVGVRVGLQLLELGDEQDHVEQVVEALAGSWPRRRSRRCPRPSPRAAGRAGELVRTLFGLAPSLSILLTAIMIGTSAARAWSIASTVCGMTPSSAATTMTATSVTLRRGRAWR